MACEDICRDPCGGDVLDGDDAKTAHDKRTCSELCQCFFQCPAENEEFFYDLTAVNSTEHPLDPAVAPVSLRTSHDGTVGEACRKAFKKDVSRTERYTGCPSRCAFFVRGSRPRRGVPRG